MAGPQAAAAPSSSSTTLPHSPTLPKKNAAASSTTPRALRKPSSNRKAPTLSKILTASTPNLRGLFTASGAPPLPSLQRKASQAALTSSSLAAIPDASESYALGSLNSSTSHNIPPRAHKMVPSPLTPRAGAMSADDVTVGDNVEVPGNMQGTVRFIGTIPGKRGIFAGVELHSEFAQRGKNNGDVEGYVHIMPPPLLLPPPHTLTRFLLLTNAPLWQNFLLYHHHTRCWHISPSQQGHPTRFPSQLRNELLSHDTRLRHGRLEGRHAKLDQYTTYTFCPPI